ncbi:hypothetical protein BJ1_gp58 [Halorubrum virus BJ1]|uniref:Uncharacterized protein n=1 Tax=Halorubrum virus BJ1 TaxID=416419 RepID=A0ZYS1_9CAUD|nr:hypothetical protein BJ1_gp58 [Halorubrum virus BJ1]CAL92480.1 hypothetical protein [Halorubrum virus BJ1]
MTTLAGFEADAREALLDELEDHAREEIAPAVQQHAHDILEAYGRENDYDVQSIIDAAETRVERRKGSVVVRWGWPEPAIFFERGTVDHVVEATNADVLSFIWEDPPRWVRQGYEREGGGWRVFLPEVEVSGLPESRFIRDTLNWLRRRFA